MHRPEIRLGIALSLVAGLAGLAEAQICTTGDARFNTGCGTGVLANNSGYANTALGDLSMNVNTGGSNNTAVGGSALLANTTGNNNTALGFAVLSNASTASNNTAVGYEAMVSNTSGYNNTAIGLSAMVLNTTGHDNTATGLQALFSNTTGNFNTAVGEYSLYSNTTGTSNTASGFNALYANTTGGNNTAFGRQVLAANTTGFGNAGQGFNALTANTTGYRNTAIGNDALQTNVAGIYNTAIGFQSGSLITGSYNVDIANTGVAGDHNTIRIGATTQVPGDTANNVIAATYIAGIYSSNISGTGDQQVFIATDGRLVTHGSSERFKTDIAPMSDVSAKLAELRPVTFRYRSDQSGTLQYGLIAEEVAKVYPELVIRDDQGRIQGVRYEELAPMLLRQAQDQDRREQEMEARISNLTRRDNLNTAQIDQLRGLVAAQSAQLAEATRQLEELKELKQAFQDALSLRGSE